MKITALDPKMNEVVKGTLFSRYSRSNLSLDELYERDFQGLEGQEKAEDFYERILVGYGDESIAELGFCHVAIEGVSLLAAKVIEDSRLGLSFIERSTRYNDYTQAGYYIPKNLNPGQKTVYCHYMNSHFEFYQELKGVLSKAFDDEGLDNQSPKRTREARVFDAVRGLLPISSLTSLGVAGNGRAFELLINKLLSHPLPECNLIGEEILREVEKVLPNFVKRISTKKGAGFRDYLRSLHELKETSKKAFYNHENYDKDDFKFEPNQKLHLEFFNDFYKSIGLEFLDIPDFSNDIPKVFYENIVLKILDSRKSRFDKLPRCFETVSVVLDVASISLGCWRDLQRHRIGHQTFDWSFGQEARKNLTFDIPKDFECLDNKDFFYYYSRYTKCMQNVLETPYSLCLGHKVPWSWSTNLRSLIYMLELRSQKQGYYEYRQLAIDIYQELIEFFPNFEGKLFVDTEI
jgi:thymidylate synthase ThyX